MPDKSNVDRPLLVELRHLRASMTYLSLPRGVLPSTLRRSILSSLEKSSLVEFCSSERIFAHVDEARKEIRG